MSKGLSSGTAKVLFPSGCILGEGPMWHVKRKSCFWVDIERGLIYEYNWSIGLTYTYEVKNKVSLILEGEEELIVCLQGGIFTFDLALQSFTLVTGLEENWATHRCNDGICDHKGRLWISTMEAGHLPGAGSVYRVDDQNFYQKYIEQATIPNGMAWSNDHKRLYYIDSAYPCIQAFLYNENTGAICFEKMVVTIPEHLGIPDGMTIDHEGMLWIALWGGYGVGCFDAESGEMVDFINVPAPYVTSCSFVGEKLEHLMITTAIADMTAEEILEFPESGHTFIVETKTRGVESHICKL